MHASDLLLRQPRAQLGKTGRVVRKATVPHLLSVPEGDIEFVL
jgi:hypothetical protein